MVAFSTACNGGGGSTEENASNGLPFDEPLEQSFNYCPSIIEEADGTRYVYYCATKESGIVRDHVYCRKGTRNSKGGYTWSEKTLVLAPTEGAYDALHCCDPTVIKGEFAYKGQTYKYLMAYTGNTDNVNNKVGLALSNNYMEGWISTGEPLITYSGDNSHWGVGQPALLSVDKKGIVLLFYAYGGNETCTYVEKWDFSDMENPIKLTSARVSDRGVNGLTGAKDSLNNIDVAYDPSTKRYYIVRDTHPYPDDGDPNFVASHFSVMYMQENGVVGDLFESVMTQAGKSWYNLATIGPAETGFPRNSNCGIVTDEYGWMRSSDKIEIMYSISKIASYGQYMWTYRIYSTIIDIKE